VTPATVLSFGAGVQSVTILHLALRGEIPRPDFVIFADTQNEPRDVYETVARSAAVCDREHIPFFSVTRGDLGAWRENGSIHTPLYTRNLTTGEEGQLFRTCTDRFKLAALKEKCRTLGMGHGASPAEMWIGFSLDEISRVGGGEMLPKWISRRFPLLDAGMRRSDCEAFLRTHGIVAAKSACTFCPYRSIEGWSLFRQRDPEGFAAALAYDESIRHSRPGHLAYVHKSLIPLSAVPLPQPNMFDPPEFTDSCETGLCEVW
jgi:hypothetical protein